MEGPEEEASEHDQQGGYIDDEIPGEGIAGGAGTRARPGIGSNEERAIKGSIQDHGGHPKATVRASGVNNGRIGVNGMNIAGRGNLGGGGGKEKIYKRKLSAKGALISKTGGMTAQLPVKVASDLTPFPY